MFSKSSLLKCLSVATLSLSSFVGCDSKLFEEPPPPESHQLGATKCLTEVKPIIKNFMQGTATTKEVNSAWDCAHTALQTFKRYVRGINSDRYTAQELATFLEKNFLDAEVGEKIPVGLQVEMMKVKQIFVGGSNAHITRTEVDRLLVFIDSLRDVTVRLTPYMRVLALQWSVSEVNNMQEEVRYFEDANKEIQNAARTLAAMIEKNNQSYKLSDFVTLMEQMSAFFGESWEFPGAIAKYMPVVKKVKKALAGGDENYVMATEWRRFLLLGARGYIQYLRYYYFIQGVPQTGTGYRLSYLARTVEDVLSVFQDLVAEKPEGMVSRQEVKELLSTLHDVWPAFKVSDKLIFEAMKIKQLFFGGSVDSFTTTDFNTARLKVSRIKILIERFLPYYMVYGREWDPSFYDPDEAQQVFMESQFVLETTVREAGLLFEGAYDLNDSVNLMNEVEALYPPEGEPYSEMLVKYLPLIIDLKNMILSGNDSSLKRDNWSVLLGFAARFYSDFLYYDYFLKDKSFEQPLIVGSLSVFVNQSLNIFRDLLKAKKEGQFSRPEISRIFEHLIALEIMPKGLTMPSLESVVDLVLNNVLTSPDRRLNGYRPDALTAESVEVLRRELQVWLDTELFIANLTETWKPDEGLLAKDLEAILNKALKNQNSTSNLAAGLQELILSVQSPVPLTVDENNQVIISNKFEQRYTARSLRQLNLYRAVSRIAIRSAAKDLERINKYQGVIFDEVQDVFLSIRPALVEMGALDSKNVTFAASRFREANIFVPHSDGNALVSHVELVDLIGMIWSGLKINTSLRLALVERCFNGDSTIGNDAAVTLSCARAAYRDAMPRVMTSMPEYLGFQKKVNIDVWTLYINNVFKAAGYIPNAKKEALLEDIALAPHVMQYIEMIYARFDTNKDGIINTAESIRAYPAFKGILLELAAEQLRKGDIKEKELLDLFTYILRYGKPPETIWEKLRFVLDWKGKKEKWDVWADRLKLAEILGYIADQVTKTKQAVEPPAIQDVNPKPSETQPEPQSPSLAG